MGSSNLPGDTATHAFLYSGGVMSDLAPIGNSYINDSGQVAGSAGNAFLYSGGVMSDLSNLFPTGTGWSIDAAYDIPFSINDSGQIAGIGTINGEQHAFILTPESAPVPEPSTFVFLCIGLGMLGYLRKKMNKV